ncbi:EGFR adapter protein-like [Culicoides brevitarsis]|uniref:EGFR adapter protein-like n=1 Tax=Culicoides brevitarsis TaxID=469753 RepID=UPI00307BF82D
MEEEKAQNIANMNVIETPKKTKRPDTLYTGRKYVCDENVNLTLKSTSSEEGPSPTNANIHHPTKLLTSTTTSISANGTVTTTATKKFLDKPTLVKRLALGLLRSTDEYRPLMQNKSSPPSPTKNFFDDEVDNKNHNKTLYDLNKIIAHKFGDSCRQSLNSVHADDTKHYEVPQQKNFLDFDNRRRSKLIQRETNSASSSPTKLPRLFGTIKRTDSLNAVEENDLRSAAWYQEGLPREISLEVLAQQSPGAFLVRRSTSKVGCFALSVRTPSPPGPKVAHYLILRTSRGYKIKGFTKEFSTLRALITHHSVMPEMLPVPLSLPRPKNILMKSRKEDDYNSYNDLKKIISELNIANNLS